MDNNAQQNQTDDQKQHVGLPQSKEREPAPSFPDVAKMTESEIVIEEKEVEKELESIIEKSPDTEKPTIPKEVQQAGVTHAHEDIPIPTSLKGSSSLPMEYDEAQFTRKKYRWKDSVAWFAALIMYHWKKIKKN